MPIRTLALATVALPVAALAGCQYFAPLPRIVPGGPADRAVLAAPQDYFGDSATQIEYLDQNWDADATLWFYNTSQGSQLLPYQVFLNLERADSQELFRSEENMRRYRYLPQRPNRDNPDG